MEYFPSIPPNTFKLCVIRYYIDIVIIIQTYQITPWAVIFELNNKIIQLFFDCPIDIYRISGVIVSMLTPSGVDRGFEPRSSQTNDYKIGICCFSAKPAALWR